MLFRSYENLTLTSFSVQGDPKSFINTGQAERKDLLAYYLELYIFDKLLELANKEVKDITNKLKLYPLEDLNTKLADNELKIQAYNNSKKLLDGTKQNINDELERLNKAILDTTKQLITIENISTNLESLEKNKSDYEKKLSEKKIKVDSDKKKLLDETTKHNNLVAEFNTLNKSEIDANYKLYTDKLLEKETTEQLLTNLTLEVKPKLKQLEQLKDLEYDPDCKYCMNNIFVKDAIKVKGEVDNDKALGEEYVAKIKVLEEEVTDLSKYDVDIQHYNECLNAIYQYTKYELPVYENAFKASTNEYELIQKNLNDTISAIDKYNQNKKNIEFNEKINAEIYKLTIHQNTKKTELADIDSELQTVIRDIAITKKDIENINSDILTAKSLEVKNKAYTYYIQCVNRQGIPFDIITSVIHHFENEINSILQQMVEFNIRIEIDDSDINAYIDYGNGKKWALELTSGMERFISSIAIRKALINISNLPKPNGFIIDEGFGVADADNLQNFQSVFDYLIKDIDFILIVSHIESMKDMVYQQIDIYQDSDRTSHINFV